SLLIKERHQEALAEYARWLQPENTCLHNGTADRERITFLQFWALRYCRQRDPDHAFRRHVLRERDGNLILVFIQKPLKRPEITLCFCYDCSHDYLRPPALTFDSV